MAGQRGVGDGRRKHIVRNQKLSERPSDSDLILVQGDLVYDLALTSLVLNFPELEKMINNTCHTKVVRTNKWQLWVKNNPSITATDFKISQNTFKLLLFFSFWRVQKVISESGTSYFCVLNILKPTVISLLYLQCNSEDQIMSSLYIAIWGFLSYHIWNPVI